MIDDGLEFRRSLFAHMLSQIEISSRIRARSANHEAKVIRSNRFRQLNRLTKVSAISLSTGSNDWRYYQVDHGILWRSRPHLIEQRLRLPLIAAGRIDDGGHCLTLLTTRQTQRSLGSRFCLVTLTTLFVEGALRH